MKHTTKKEILNSTVPVSIAVIGAGGTGSMLVRELARINYTLKQLDFAGLYVTIYDPKDVNEVSPVRQVFTPADNGENKALCLATKVNRAYGTNWEGVPDYYDFSNHNIVITCVDQVKVRMEVNEKVKSKEERPQWSQEDSFYYWIDCGNSKSIGQVVLGGCGLKTVVDLHPDLESHEDINEPSCSAMQTLTHQDLFINSRIAMEAADIIWKLFKHPITETHGIYVNMAQGSSRKIKIAA